MTSRADPSLDDFDLEQIRTHLSGLRQKANDTQRLAVLTPDHSRSKKLNRIEDDRLVWTNFDQFADAAESILARDHGSAEQSLENSFASHQLLEVGLLIYDNQ